MANKSLPYLITCKLVLLSQSYFVTLNFDLHHGSRLGSENCFRDA